MSRFRRLGLAVLAVAGMGLVAGGLALVAPALGLVAAGSFLLVIYIEART